MKRCRPAKTAMIGIATVVATAISMFHWVPYWPMNLFRATVIGWTPLGVSESAKTNSPQAKRKAKTATVISPAATSGRAIARRRRTGAAVDERGRLQLPRHGEEEGTQDDDGERQGEVVLGQDQRRVGVDAAPIRLNSTKSGPAMTMLGQELRDEQEEQAPAPPPRSRSRASA